MKPDKMLVAVDAIVFTIIHDNLKVLLIKRKYEPYKGEFALPGGFVKLDENPEKAVKRELSEETGVKNIYLKQLGTYGNVDRDPRGRVLSIAYLALVHGEQELHATTDAIDAKWLSAYDLRTLAFDHKKIIKDALTELRLEIQTTNIAFQILPVKFTLTEMQRLYELVLDKELDKRNFRKKIKELSILKETTELKMEGAHRPAKLYMFKDTVYKPLSEKMQVFL